VSKARKRHRQPWWKNKAKTRKSRQWGRFAAALGAVFPRGYCAIVAEVE